MKRLITLIAVLLFVGCHGRYDSPTSPTPTPRPATQLRIVLRIDSTSNNRCTHTFTQVKAKVTGIGYEIPPFAVRHEFPSEVVAPNNKDFVVTYWQEDEPLIVYTSKSDIGRFNTDAVTVDLSCVYGGAL
jgi:hypothetical protein